MVQKKNNKIVLSKSLMLNGKGSLSEKLVNITLKGIQKKTKKDCRLVFKLALKNTLIPVSNIVIKKKRKNKKNNYIPFLLMKEKRIYKVIKHICSDAGIIKLKDNRFLNEILKLANNKGILKTKSKSISHLSFLNKNFLHFRWF